MAAYTIEDIELIRRKSGITYQEAVSLLDYHNGNLARALVDLERNGRINSQGAASTSQEKVSPNAAAATEAKTGSSAKNGFFDLLAKLYCARVKITKGDVTVINLSVLFLIIAAVISLHIPIIGAIVSLVLGYKFSFEKSDPAFAGERIEKMVKNAAENVRSSVSDFARGFQDGRSEQSASASAQAADPVQNSYYTSRPTATASYRPDVPTINVPVQVESQDGRVTVEGDSEGYTSATID